MSETLPNIELPRGEWVDLYAASGIAVGTLIQVQNIGVCDVYLTTSPTEPADDTNHQILPRAFQAENESGSTGEWALCLNSIGAVSVRIAV